MPGDELDEIGAPPLPRPTPTPQEARHDARPASMRLQELLNEQAIQDHLPPRRNP